jgi:transcriptional regulator with GAF, ATPase, and Fis domain
MHFDTFQHGMESGFFGYKKGAFSGAYLDKCGYLDIADMLN